MKKLNARSIVIGFIIGSIMTTSVGYAASTLTKISVDLSPVSIKVNDKLVEGSQTNTFHNGQTNVPLSMVYNGTTYVPLRLISQALNKQIEWDHKSHTISITDKGKGIVAGSIEHTLTYDGQGSLIFTIKNQTENDQTLTFNTGQKYDYILWNDQGEKVQQYSVGKLFTQMVTAETLKPGEEKIYTASLSGLKKGNYKAEFWLATQSAPLKQTLSFEVTQDLAATH